NTLKMGRGLRDFVGKDGNGNGTWYQKYVQAIDINNNLIAQSTAKVWWSNPVSIYVPNPPTTFVSGGIYIIDQDISPSATISIPQDKVALVSIDNPTTTYIYPGMAGGDAIVSSGRFNWIEVSINSLISLSSGIKLMNATFNRIQRS